MARYFDEHIRRRVLTLDGTWCFLTDPADVGREEGWYRRALCGEHVHVPSVWNTDLAHLTYEGVGWYQRRFSVTEAGALCLSFGAVMTHAEVYLDGTCLGEHYGGFCRFRLFVDRVEAGEHTLTVRVDNRFDKQSIPQTRVDWYHYGGITRSVEAHLLRGIAVMHDRLDYTLDHTARTAEARLTLELYCAEERAASDTVRVCLDGMCVATLPVTLSAFEHRTVTVAFSLSGLRLWSPEEPSLYALAIETATDDLHDRVGFRHIEVKGGRVLLNGRDTELYGANRHEDHPDFGMAFPPALMKRDIDIAQRMGCNSLRGSHYPNHPIFLDMLDERGMLFWSEIPIWGCGFAPETLADPVVLERGLQMHREMVHEYFNHPSIILWGMHNEIANETPEAYAMTRLYYDYLKAEGGDRLVTYASREPLLDICFELCDIICVNRYHGWYLGEIEAWDDYLERFAARKEALGLADKPVIMSEFGAAAIYGHHSFDDVRWTEEYQARLMDYCIRHFFARPDYVGTYIWQFTDMRTSPDMGTDRARGFNNKGVLNEHRKPKLAFDAVRRAYEDQKRVHEERFGK